MTEHRHIPGPFSQHNKPFKAKHRSKREQRNATKGKLLPSRNCAHKLRCLGKVGLRNNLKSNSVTSLTSKQARKNALRNKRIQVRDEVVFSKELGSSVGAPRIVGVVPLGMNADIEHTMTALLRLSDTSSISLAKPLTVKYAYFPFFIHSFFVLFIQLSLLQTTNDFHLSSWTLISNNLLGHCQSG